MVMDDIEIEVGMDDVDGGKEIAAMVVHEPVEHEN